MTVLKTQVTSADNGQKLTMIKRRWQFTGCEFKSCLHTIV